MTFQTFLAKIANFFHLNASTTAKLARLKVAVETDYDAVVQKAEAALKAGAAEVESMAHAELASIENTLASVRRRAAALHGTAVLKHEKAEAVVALSQVGTTPAA